MQFQRQLSNGNWTDCTDRIGEFVERAVSLSVQIAARREHTILTTESVMAKLAAGNEVAYGSDWSSMIRATPAPRPVAPRAADTRPLLRCKCGNTGHAGAYPFSTLPGSGRCDDCV